MKFDFTKNRKVKKLETVPENFRAFYAEVEGDDEGFALRDDSVTTAAVAAISGLNGALVKVRAEVDTAKKAKTIDLSGLSEYGETIEAITSGVKSKVEELSSKATASNKTIEVRIAQIQKEHTDAITKLTADNAGVLKAKDGSLHTYMLDTSIMTAAGGWTGLNPTLVKPFARKQMAVQDVDGTPRVVVLGSDNEARYSKLAERAGELMQTDELLVEMSEQEDFKQLFPSKQANGGGGSQTSRTQVGIKKPGAKNQTSAEKISAGLASQKK